MQTPVVASQSRTVPSSDPEVRQVPLGEKVTDLAEEECLKTIRHESKSDSAPWMTLIPVSARFLYLEVNAMFVGVKGRTDCHTC